MGFTGICFTAHNRSMDCTPTHIDNIDYVWANNAIYDDLYIGTDPNVLTEIPSNWDWSTVMYATFNGNLTAGNLNYMLSQLSALRVKRKRKQDTQWITLFEIPVATAEDMQFYLYDKYVQWGQEYEYALVPVVDQIEALTVSLEVTPTFNGMYITDGDTSYYTLAGNGIQSYQRNHGGTAVETLAQKYPYHVKNSSANYDTGSAEGIFLPVNPDNCTISTEKLFDYRKSLSDFLLNGRAKILKDCFGQIWMVQITDVVSHSRDGHPSVVVSAFNWSEIGDPNSQKDLFDYGFTNVAPHITEVSSALYSYRK